MRCGCLQAMGDDAIAQSCCGLERIPALLGRRKFIHEFHRSGVESGAPMSHWHPFILAPVVLQVMPGS